VCEEPNVQLSVQSAVSVKPYTELRDGSVGNVERTNRCVDRWRHTGDFTEFLSHAEVLTISRLFGLRFAQAAAQR
jgi:hypothetical protein